MASSGPSAVHDRKIHVDARLNALRRDQLRGTPGLQGESHGFERVGAMRGAHVGREVIYPRSPPRCQQVGKELRLPLQVDDAEDLALVGKLIGEHAPGDRLVRPPLNANAAGGDGKLALLDFGGDLARLPPGDSEARDLLVEVVKRWLCCSCEHDACAEPLAEPRKRRQRRYRQVRRQCLHFVKQDNAPGKPVQLSARRWAICHERFKALHARRQHDRCVPVLRKQPRETFALVCRVGSGRRYTRGWVNVAVILNDKVIGKTLFATKQAAVNRRRLLDNVEKRHHKDNAAEAVLDGVTQGEGQHRERLARPRRRRECEDALRPLAGFQACARACRACHLLPRRPLPLSAAFPSDT